MAQNAGTKRKQADEVGFGSQGHVSAASAVTGVAVDPSADRPAKSARPEGDLVTPDLSALTKTESVAREPDPEIAKTAPRPVAVPEAVAATAAESSSPATVVDGVTQAVDAAPPAGGVTSVA